MNIIDNKWCCLLKTGVYHIAFVTIFCKLCFVLCLRIPLLVIKSMLHNFEWLLALIHHTLKLLVHCWSVIWCDATHIRHIRQMRYILMFCSKFHSHSWPSCQTWGYVFDGDTVDESLLNNANVNNTCLEKKQQNNRLLIHSQNENFHIPLQACLNHKA